MNKIFYIILALVCIVYLFSCTSAPKHLAKAIQKDKSYVAAETRKLWPCIVTASDTTYLTDTLYDFIEPVPEIYKRTPGEEYVYPSNMVRVDTVFKQRTITKTAFIKTKVEDSAKTFLLLNNIEVLENKHKDELAAKDKENAELKKTVTSQTKTIKRQRKTLTIFWGFVILLGLGIAVKLYLKFKPL